MQENINCDNGTKSPNLLWVEVKDVYHLKKQKWFQIYSVCGLMQINMVLTLKKKKSEDQNKNDYHKYSRIIFS